MNKEPLVSVVISTFNRALLLSRAVKSVCEQTYKELEIIIVDDGSVDNTEELVKSFNDKRIIYIRHKKNQGISATRNTGIKSSKGEFIAILDDDDEYLSEKIEKSIDIFMKYPGKYGAVCSNYYRVEGGNKYIAVSKKFPFLMFPIYSNNVFKEIGYLDESLEILADLEFMTRFIGKYASYFIDTPLANYNINRKGLSFNPNYKRKIEIKKLILDRYTLSLKKGDMKCASILARIEYYLAKDFFAIGDIEQGRIYLLKAFFAHPVKIEYFWKYLMSCFKR